MKKILIVVAASSSAVILNGCGEKEPNVPTTQTSPAWLLTSAPNSIADVADTKRNASEGDTVTVRGIIGGRVDALSEESALFVMVDAKVPNKCVEEDEHCSTPWDYCCAPVDEVRQNSATVQIVDDAGKPINIDLTSIGIHSLDTVVVVGTVGPRPTDDVLTIRATSIYRNGQ